MRDGKWNHSLAEPQPEKVLRSREMMDIPLKIGSSYLPLDPATRQALDDWYDSEEMIYETAKFTRSEIARWLSVNQLKSAYWFDLGEESTALTTLVQTDADLSPDDLPEELYLANLAYRAVLNGYGDKSDTFRNRLIDYLRTNYTDLKPDAVKRLATVANPDKSAGRKKRDKE